MTSSEEVHLAKAMEAGVLAQAAPPTVLTETERRILIARGELARQRFMTANLGLVGWVVTRDWRDTETEELFQEGVLGLDRAVRGYDYRRGGFAAYAVPWIRQAVLSARANRVERSVRWYRDWRQVRSVEDTLTQRLKREVGWQEVAAELHQSGEWVRSRQILPAATVEPETLLLLTEEVVVNPDFELPADAVTGLLDHLEVLPRRLLELRFGLHGHRPHSRKKAAAQLGISEKQATRIEAQAIEDLRGICPHQMGEYLAA